MDDYAGRVLADRYRLPLPPSDEYDLAETRGFDTYSGQEVLLRQVPLPEVVEAEVVDADGRAGAPVPRRTPGRTTRRPTDPAVLRAVEAAQAAAQIPDHPRLDQVFDVFAEAGSLWIVSERVAARPLAALLADKPLSPYRAAEVASDVLTALSVLHAHGWIHRNITSRTVLVCDDGRVVLTGLAAGAAEEALCGYAPVPFEAPEAPPGDPSPDTGTDTGTDVDTFSGTFTGTGPADGYGAPSGHPHDDSGYEYDDGVHPGEREQPDQQVPAPAPGTGGGGVPDVRAARAGAIAAYRAGARAAARISEEQRQGGRPVQTGHDPDWWAREPQPQESDAYGDDDEYGSENPGHARLAGTWHD
ncbi:protein kinase, partial [Streptomyces sp. NPDC055078]